LTIKGKKCDWLLQKISSSFTNMIVIKQQSDDSIEQLISSFWRV
jgi:hypothetical protein